MLINLTQKSKYSTLMLLGNGIVENGTQPLINALDEANHLQYFHHNCKSTNPITTLSIAVANKKNIFYNLILRLKKKLNATDEQLKHNILMLYCYIKFREIVAAKYAQSSLNIRPSIMFHLVKMGILNHNTICFTTNWDTSLLKLSTIPNIVHLHGICTCCSSLILPNESVLEKAMNFTNLQEVAEELEKNATRLNISPQIIKEIFNYYDLSTKETANVQLFEADTLFSHNLKQVETIVIAGFGFNDYDYEILASIAQMRSEKSQQIIYIDKMLDTKINSIYDSLKKLKEQKITQVQGLLNCERHNIKYIDTINDCLSDNLIFAKKMESTVVKPI